MAKMDTLKDLYIGPPRGTGQERPLRHEFQFIYTGNTAHIEEDSKLRIRTHVMQDFHRRKLERHDQVEDSEAGLTTVLHITTQTHKFRLSPCGLEKKPIHRRKRRQRRLLRTLPVRNAGELSHGPTPQPASYVRNTQFRKLSRPARRGDITKSNHSASNADQHPILSAASEDGNSAMPTVAADRVDDTSPPPSWDGKPDLLMQEILQRDPGRGLGDPFATIPFLSAHRLQNLLSYAHPQVSLPSVMTNLRKNWALMATEDLACYHAALSMFSGAFVAIKQNTRILDPLWHVSKAVKIVNSRLGVPDLEICDGTILAVACLVNYETVNGTLLGVRTHMEGLKKMVKMRGGLRSAGFPPSLQRKIAWADINSASVLFSEPKLSSIECPNRDRLLRRWSPGVKLTGVKLSNPHGDSEEFRDGLQVWRGEVSRLFVELRHLAGFFLSSHYLELPETDCILYSDWVYSIKRSLLSFSNVAENEVAMSMRIDAASCIAALVVVETRFRHVGPESHAIKRFLGRQQTLIKSALNDVSFLLTNPATAKVLLWALFIGGTAAWKDKDRSWFVSHSAWLCWFLGISDWGKMEAVLEGVLWQKHWDMTYMALWNEVESTILTIIDTAKQ